MSAAGEGHPSYGFGLKIENKFLSRGALQPEDVTAAPSTASSTLAVPATALAARARRRPGRGPRRTR